MSFWYGQSFAPGIRWIRLMRSKMACCCTCRTASWYSSFWSVRRSVGSWAITVAVRVPSPTPCSRSSASSPNESPGPRNLMAEP